MPSRISCTVKLMVKDFLKTLLVICNSVDGCDADMHGLNEQAV